MRSFAVAVVDLAVVTAINRRRANRLARELGPYQLTVGQRTTDLLSALHVSPERSIELSRRLNAFRQSAIPVEPA
jgi:hypothetical protein